MKVIGSYTCGCGYGPSTKGERLEYCSIHGGDIQSEYEVPSDKVALNMVRKQPEHEEQAALMQWVAYITPQIPEFALLFAIPNARILPRRLNKKGEWFSPVGQRLQEEGMKRGIPDLFFPVGRGGFHGLWIEMKSGNGRLTKEQKWWREYLIRQNFCFRTCLSWQEAGRCLLVYLGVDHVIYSDIFQGLNA